MTEVLAPPVGEVVEWHKAAVSSPEPGHKFVALYDDGSGAWLGFAHDSGIIDADGDDHRKMPNAEWWAYLPSGFRLGCEDHPVEEFEVQLGDHVCPSLPAPTVQVGGQDSGLLPPQEASVPVVDGADVAGQWQPIETAPETSAAGVRVDIWLEPVPELHAQFANGATKGWRLADAWFNGSAGAGWRNNGSYNGRQRNEIATHWMPCPVSPETSA